MLIGQILLGLPILGILVFFHELGHFLAARACGIAVEVFSLGMGPRIWGFSRQGTEYRLSAIPLGGYCRMKGEKDMSNALEKGLPRIEASPGSYYAKPPLARMAVVLAGPAANLVLAVLFMTIINLGSQDYRSIPPRLVLYSDIKPGISMAADRGGLKTGDTIISIQGKPVASYRSLYLTIAQNARTELSFVVDRAGQALTLLVTPELQPDTGAGKIGILPWQAPVLADDSGPALPAGLLPGDRLVAVNGQPVAHAVAAETAMTQARYLLLVTVERQGQGLDVVLTPPGGSASPGLPRLSFATRTYTDPGLGLPAAMAKGLTDTLDTLGLTLRSLGHLFSGLNPQSAVSGPLRISYLAGENTLQSLGNGFSAGIRSILEFMALVSIALCFGNLLPIPALDGGQFLLFVVELASRRPLSPKLIQNYQLVGVMLVLGLTIFAFYGDFTYFFGLILGN